MLTECNIPVVTVGDTQDWLPELIARAKDLKVGNGFDPSTEMYADYD